MPGLPSSTNADRVECTPLGEPKDIRPMSREGSGTLWKGGGERYQDCQSRRSAGCRDAFEILFGKGPRQFRQRRGVVGYRHLIRSGVQTPLSKAFRGRFQNAAELLPDRVSEGFATSGRKYIGAISRNTVSRVRKNDISTFKCNVMQTLNIVLAPIRSVAKSATCQIFVASGRGTTH